MFMGEASYSVVSLVGLVYFRGHKIKENKSYD